MPSNTLTGAPQVLIVGLDIVCELLENRLLHEVVRHAELRSEEDVGHIVLHPDAKNPEET